MPTLDDTLRALPKVELHLHLEGAIPLPALWELVEKYGPPPEVRSLRELEQRFHYTDFAHFLDTWVWKNGFLREYEDFTFVAQAVAADLARQNIRYAEAFVSPGDFVRHGLEPRALIQAVRRGLDRQASRIRVQLVPDLIRDRGPEQGARWLEEMAEVRDLGVIGIGIGGSEQAFPPEPYARVFERARQLGLRTSAHAGEAAGPESVRGALEALRVDRIGHGTRAAEDPALVELLRLRQVPLEMCPLSNVRTRTVPDLASHPIRTFFDRGLLVTVNTDDPAMFGNSLEVEYRALMVTFGFTLSEVVSLVRNAIRAAWCDDALKTGLLDELDGFLASHPSSALSIDGA